MTAGQLLEAQEWRWRRWREAFRPHPLRRVAEFVRNWQPISHGGVPSEQCLRLYPSGERKANENRRRCPVLAVGASFKLARWL